MRTPGVLFGLVVLLALGLGGLLLGAGESAVQLVPHPEHPSLLRAAPGTARIAPVFGIGVAFGLLVIAFFGACFALGMRGRRPLQGVLREILVGVALYEGVFAGLLLAYRAYLVDPSGGLVLGFPAPTAIMLFGLWPVPLVFLGIYLRHFDAWAPDEAEIRRLADARDRDGGG